MDYDAAGVSQQARSLYDEKVAQTPENKYSDANPQKWLEWTRGYLVGRRWEMENILRWAESWAKVTIPEDAIAGLRQNFCMDDGFAPVKADRDLWSFLNLNVSGTAAEGKFRTVKRLRGLEAWRVIVVPIEPKTLTKRRELHRAVHHPSQCKKLSEVEQAIIDWEKDRDDYYSCGGQQIQESEQCTIILDLLPSDTPSTLMMALEDYEGDFNELKKKIDKQITFLADHAKSHAGRVNLADERSNVSASQAGSSVEGDADDLDDEASAQLAPSGGVDLTIFSEPVQDSILATMRASGDRRPVRMGRTAARGGNTARPRARTPPKGSGERKVRCGNCGEEHETRHCTKPMLEMSKRKCFECGKEGHEARKCPEKKKNNGGDRGGRGGGGRGRGAHVVEQGGAAHWVMMVRPKD